jgi:hypothetical protein
MKLSSIIPGCKQNFCAAQIGPSPVWPCFGLTRRLCRDGREPILFPIVSLLLTHSLRHYPCFSFGEERRRALLEVSGMRTGISERRAHPLQAESGLPGPLPRICGADSSPRRDIPWLVNMDDSADPILDLRWRERGIPAVPVRPALEGFGRELIEEALPRQLGGPTSTQLINGSICCRITMPLVIHDDDSGSNILAGEDGR